MYDVSIIIITEVARNTNITSSSVSSASFGFELCCCKRAYSIGLVSAPDLRKPAKGFCIRSVAKYRWEQGGLPLWLMSWRRGANKSGGVVLRSTFYSYHMKYYSSINSNVPRHWSLKLFYWWMNIISFSIGGWISSSIIRQMLLVFGVYHNAVDWLIWICMCHIILAEIFQISLKISTFLAIFFPKNLVK